MLPGDGAYVRLSTATGEYARGGTGTMASYQVYPSETVDGQGNAAPAREAAASASRRTHSRMNMIMALVLCAFHFAAIVYGLSKGGPHILWALFGVVMIAVISMSLFITWKSERPS